jgi:hypothetical protein
MPPPKWWNERDKAKQLDDLVKAYTRQTPGLEYCETYDLSIDPSGNPRRDLYVSDACTSTTPATNSSPTACDRSFRRARCGSDVGLSWRLRVLAV